MREVKVENNGVSTFKKGPWRAFSESLGELTVERDIARERERERTNI